MIETIQNSNNFATQEVLFAEAEVQALPTIGGAILKSTARCDFACRHCYVFEAADSTWQLLPRKLEDTTIAKTGERIAEYVEAHDLQQFQVILHGGEPFLYGRQHTQRIVESIRSSVRNTTHVAFAAHSNAGMLGKKNERSRALLDYLQENRISVSTSLDGDRRSNDFYRLYRDGSSTYEDTIAGINALKERGLLRGILGVIILGDIDFDRPAEDVLHELSSRGLENYHALLELEPKKIDFLLPLGHRGNLPAGMTTKEHRALNPYATWLKPVFDAWYKTAQHKYFNPTSPEAHQYLPDVRTFSSIISGLEGRPSAVEAIGSLGLVDSVVIDTDGQYGVVDTLAATEEGEYRLGLNIHSASIDQAVRAVVDNARVKGMATLPSECGSCPVRAVCQGGYTPHRYDPNSPPGEAPYSKKTIYSSNLLDLIAHIHGRHVTAKVSHVGQRSQRQFYGNSYETIAF